jgi:signal peptidase II
MKLKKRDWAFILTPLFITWAIDQGTKEWAKTLKGITWHNIPFGLPDIGFVLHHNHGAMLGIFSDLPPALRIVSLATGGAFLIFVFGVIQYLLPIRSLLLRSGLAVLLGGILGNVTDRITYGYVIDFLLVGSPETSRVVFNLADVLQWVGYAMIAWALVSQGEILWPAANARRKIWINQAFQLRYSLILVGVGLSYAIIAGVFAYTFMRVTIIDLVGQNQRLLDHYLDPFIFTYICVSLGFGVALFLIGRLLSARIAGPLFAFERWLDDLVEGKSRSLRLRAGDEFKHLEDTAARLSSRFSANTRPASVEPAGQPPALSVVPPSGSTPVNLTEGAELSVSTALDADVAASLEFAEVSSKPVGPVGSNGEGLPDEPGTKLNRAAGET